MAREAKDLLLKRIAATIPDTFLSILGLDLPPVVAVLPADVPVLRVHVASPDLLLRLADGSLVQIEFQTTSKPGDLRRFYRYQFALSEEHDCLVHTIVIYGAGITAAESFLDRGSSKYTVRNIYLGQRDAEALVTRLRARAAASESWSTEEQVEAILLPLMRRERALPELLEEVAAASTVLPLEERTNVLGSMVGLAYNYLDAGVAEQLLEALRGMNAFEELVAEWIVKGRDQGLAEGRDQGLAEGRNQGLAEGRAEGRREDVLKILDRHFGPVPAAILDQIRALNDAERLAELIDAALDAKSLDSFERILRDTAARA